MLRLSQRQSLLEICICICCEKDLARTIAISDEVYELLKRSKLPGESFSTVIKRNLRKGRLSEIAGTSILSQEDWVATRKELAAADALTLKKLMGQN